MKKIAPHLWFDQEAHEAVELYTSLFEDSRILSSHVINDTPSGDCEILSFVLLGEEFQAISAGPYFKFNPSISFMVCLDSKDKIDWCWEALVAGGEIMMPLDAYPFCQWYGWIRDRYGMSWQLFLKEEPVKQKIMPNLLFTGPVCGLAEEAVREYTEIFRHSSVDQISYYGEGEAEQKEAKINFAQFELEGFTMTAMDNGYSADYGFNEAISFMVSCEDQAEVDYFWDALSADPEAEQCGWLKDRFGVSWQIIPKALGQLMEQATPEQADRITQAFLKMKKFIVADLEAAFNMN